MSVGGGGGQRRGGAGPGRGAAGSRHSGRRARSTDGTRAPWWRRYILRSDDRRRTRTFPRSSTPRCFLAATSRTRRRASRRIAARLPRSGPPAHSWCSESLCVQRATRERHTRDAHCTDATRGLFVTRTRSRRAMCHRHAMRQACATIAPALRLAAPAGNDEWAR